MQSGTFFVHALEFDQIFDIKVGERLDTVLSDAKDPDRAVLDLHFIGDVPQPVLIYAKTFSSRR